MSYSEVMDLPIRMFWTLNAQIARLRAEERLPMIDLFMLANMNSDPKAVAQVRESHKTLMDEPMKVAKTKADVDDNTHKEGVRKLRLLKARMSGKAITKDGEPSSQP